MHYDEQYNVDTKALQVFLTMFWVHRYEIYLFFYNKEMMLINKMIIYLLFYVISIHVCVYV